MRRYVVCTHAPCTTRRVWRVQNPVISAALRMLSAAPSAMAAAGENAAPYPTTPRPRAACMRLCRRSGMRRSPAAGCTRSSCGPAAPPSRKRGPMAPGGAATTPRPRARAGGAGTGTSQAAAAAGVRLRGARDRSPFGSSRPTSMQTSDLLGLVGSCHHQVEMAQMSGGLGLPPRRSPARLPASARGVFWRGSSMRARTNAACVWLAVLAIPTL